MMCTFVKKNYTMNISKLPILIALFAFTFSFSTDITAKKESFPPVELVKRNKTALNLFLNPDSASFSKKSPVKNIIYDKKRMVFSTYVVKDFSKWEQIYNEKSAIESKFACTLRTDTNITKVGVFQFTTSHNDFRKKIASKSFKDFKNKSGIQSTPEHLFLNVMWMNPVQAKKSYYILITHKVVDYVKWKVLFDGDRGNRGMFGISDVIVATHENDLNNVTTLFTTDNFEICKELFANEDIIAILRTGGVVGDINITYWKVM